MTTDHEILVSELNITVDGELEDDEQQIGYFSYLQLAIDEANDAYAAQRALETAAYVAEVNRPYEDQALRTAGWLNGVCIGVVGTLLAAGSAAIVLWGNSK